MNYRLLKRHETLNSGDEFGHAYYGSYMAKIYSWNRIGSNYWIGESVSRLKRSLSDMHVVRRPL